MNKTVLIRVLLSSVLAGLVAFVMVSLKKPARGWHDVDWWMVNVNRQSQGDAHLLRFPDGALFAIDLGDGNDHFPAYLRRHAIKRLDTILITHWHRDHYEGIRTLIADGVSIGRVISNVPPKYNCDREIPWGCSYGDIMQILELLKAKGIPHETTRRGDYLYSDSVTRLRVVYVHDGKKPPVGDTDVNDTSIIARLVHPGGNILFTGDLNHTLGAYLAKSDIPIDAALFKVPHHGAEGLAPNEFFDRVNPKVAFIPAPKSLWLSERSKRPREYFESHHIPVFVNGIDGDIHVHLSSTGFRIRRE